MFIPLLMNYYDPFSNLMARINVNPLPNGLFAVGMGS